MTRWKVEDKRGLLDFVQPLRPLVDQEERAPGRGAGVPTKNPRALRSSSISGQWTPSPCAISSHRARCSGVARSKRQD